MDREGNDKTVQRDFKISISHETEIAKHASAISSESIIITQVTKTMKFHILKITQSERGIKSIFIYNIFLKNYDKILSNGQKLPQGGKERHKISPV